MVKVSELEGVTKYLCKQYVVPARAAHTPSPRAICSASGPLYLGMLNREEHLKQEFSLHNYFVQYESYLAQIRPSKCNCRKCGLVHLIMYFSINCP